MGIREYELNQRGLEDRRLALIQERFDLRKQFELKKCMFCGKYFWDKHNQLKWNAVCDFCADK